MKTGLAQPLPLSVGFLPLLGFTLPQAQADASFLPCLASG